MNEETFNRDIRKFLKKVGITSQREIEKATWSRLESGALEGDERFPVKMHLEVPELGIDLLIEDTVALE
jgi:hypothetical protein